MVENSQLSQLNIKQLMSKIFIGVNRPSKKKLLFSSLHGDMLVFTGIVFEIAVHNYCRHASGMICK